MNLLQQLEADLADALQTYGAIFVGHVAGGGVWVTAFYSHSLLPAEVTLGKSTTRVEATAGEGWEWYEQHLAPNEVEYELSHNRPTHVMLAEQGDVASIERPVDFNAFFPTRELRAAFQADIEAHGFQLGEEHEWEDDAQATTFGCEVQLTTSLEPGTIAEICAKVRGISSRHSGELDGWGTEVCKDTPPGT